MRSLLVLLLLAPTAHPAQLYRCAGSDGGISYQSEPCARHQRLTRTIGYVPQPDSTPRVALNTPDATVRVPRQRAVRIKPSGSRRAKGDRCATERAKQHAALERLGLRRTFDDLSRLDALVRHACGGY